MQQRELARKQGISPILIANPSTAGWNEAFHCETKAETESPKVPKTKQSYEVEEHEDSDAEASRSLSPIESSSSQTKSSSSCSWSLYAQRYRSDTIHVRNDRIKEMKMNFVGEVGIRGRNKGMILVIHIELEWKN